MARSQNQEQPVAKMLVLSFQTPDDFRQWLSENLTQTEGVWLRIFKKASGEVSVSYSEALDEALCFGWIDAQKKPFDDVSWLQRFCPRRSKGKWSRVNTEHAERLIQAGRVMAEGMKEIEAAKADGRWIAAYDSPKGAEPPPDFMERLVREPAAHAFYKTLNRANIYAIVYRLQTAKKPETREKRITAILEMLRRQEKFH